MSTLWEQRLAEEDVSARETRRPFDVAAGLRRLAEEAGYVPPAAAEPSSSRARHHLEVVARWVLTQAGAAAHVEELTAVIGDSEFGDFDGWTDDVDVHGVHVFACTLYLAAHPESALFWWQLAAGAGHSGAAYCLHLHHLSTGEIREAAFWKRQVNMLFDGPTDEFFEGLETFTGYTVRHRTHARTTTPPRLAKEFERLADLHDDGGLVGRPDNQLADHIHDLAGHP
ncbi:hypothetical protein ACWD01_37100 [Streptomyces sp. NPDC002835]